MYSHIRDEHECVARSGVSNMGQFKYLTSLIVVLVCSGCCSPKRYVIDESGAYEYFGRIQIENRRLDTLIPVGKSKLVVDASMWIGDKDEMPSIVFNVIVYDHNSKITTRKICPGSKQCELIVDSGLVDILVFLTAKKAEKLIKVVLEPGETVEVRAVVGYYSID